MYAIIETGGKQVKVQKGDVIFIEKIAVEEAQVAEFDKVVLAVSADDSVKVGNPYLEDVNVKGIVLKHDKAKKIIVFKFKAKKDYRKKQGHRQPYTKVEITEINA